MQIAELLKKSPTTISREIERHKVKVTRPGAENDCINRQFCDKEQTCNGTRCTKRSCQECTSCINFCNSYKKIYCQHRDTPPYVCEGCNRIQQCRRPKFRYYPERAHTSYQNNWRTVREGVGLTEGQLAELDTIVSPLIKKGQSIAHIYANHQNEIPCSIRTIYQYIQEGYLSAKNLDLLRKVKYKPRRKKRISKEFALKIREGRRYADFLEHLGDTDDAVVEMDTVAGCRGSKKTILTLHFRQSRLLIAFLMDDNTQKSVVHALDGLEHLLGKEQFKQALPVILADNGMEFLSPSLIETSSYGGHRTRLYYCDPLSPGQKGGIEKNHVELRKVLPKGTSFDSLSQEELLLAVNHINSYSRASLNGKTAFDIATLLFNKSFFKKLGLAKVHPDEVCLTPSLLK